MKPATLCQLIASSVVLLACTAPEQQKPANAPTSQAPAPPPGPPVAPVANEDGTQILEAESMTLADCETVPHAGGQAVKLLGNDCTGSAQVTLPKGEYLINAYVAAPDGEHDAFYIGVGDDKFVRMFPQAHQNKWSYSAKFLTFSVAADGAQTLKFATSWPGQKPGESGLLIDRLEIVESGKSAKQLERWQKK